MSEAGFNYDDEWFLNTDRLSRMVEKAKVFAKVAHRGQVTKRGEDYFLCHVQPVVSQFSITDYKHLGGDFATLNRPEVALLPEYKIGQCVAYLHDVVEDTDVTIEDLAAMGFPPTVWAAVRAITMRRSETRQEYMLRATGHRIARVVKIADHNVNVSTLDLIEDQETRRRLKKKYADDERILFPLLAVNLDG